MAGAKVLVLGGAGYIGSILTPTLLAEGFQVTVLDQLIFRQVTLLDQCISANFRFVRGDVLDRSLVAAEVARHDIIIPLAAMVGSSACDRSPELTRAVNLESIQHLLSVRSRDQPIIFPTTNSGYGVGSLSKECTEETPLNPISLYGTTKVQAENLLLDAGDAITLRLATAFGLSPRMRLDLLVNDFTYQAFRQRYIVLFEENFRRNFIHVRDIAYTFQHCIQNWHRLKDEPYNVGLSQANLTKKELAYKIKEHVPEFEIFFSPMGEDMDKRDYMVSNQKLESTGWAPRIDLDAGITELLKGYRMMYFGHYSNA